MGALAGFALQHTEGPRSCLGVQRRGGRALNLLLSKQRALRFAWGTRHKHSLAIKVSVPMGLGLWLWRSHGNLVVERQVTPSQHQQALNRL